MPGMRTKNIETAAKELVDSLPDDVTWDDVIMQHRRTRWKQTTKIVHQQSPKASGGHLSSGTPAMAAVWLLLGKTRYPATFYETFAGKSWVTEVPFELTIDVLPEILKNPDSHLQHLASQSPSEIEGFGDIVGDTRAIRDTVGRAKRAAARGVTVLLLGESGTGKEMFAQAIHNASPRRDKPLLAINCAALSRTLLESELLPFPAAMSAASDYLTMQSINFEFLRAKWPELAGLAGFAEAYAHADAVGAIAKLRMFCEQVVEWIHHDQRLPKPYQANLSDLLANQPFRDVVPAVVLSKLHGLRKEGNKSVHGNAGDTTSALRLLREAYNVGRWLYVTYAGGQVRDCPEFTQPSQGGADGAAQRKEKRAILERIAAQEAQMQKLLADLEQQRSRAKQAEATAEDRRAALEAALKAKDQLQALDPLSFNEAETRAYLIDQMLADEGWDVGKGTADTDQVKKEYPVSHQPTESGRGAADYALFDDNGKPLAVIEAKRTSENPQKGRTQAKRYADGLEKDHGQRPVIFYTNGYDLWIWNDAAKEPWRKLYGFYSKDSLQHIVYQRTEKRPVSEISPRPAIAGRMYQIEAVRRVVEKFAQKKRKALIVLATGTGKTRVAISLSDAMIQAGWAKRVLFLCDRRELRKQGNNAFKEFLPSEPRTYVTGASAGDTEYRIYLATYPAMMKVYESFDVGFFDLAVELIARDIASLPTKSIAVREKWKQVQSVQRDETLQEFSAATKATLRQDVAPLMQWIDITRQEEAWRFDRLVAQAQIELIRRSSKFDDLRDEIVVIVSSLRINLSQVKVKLPIIEQVKSSEFWHEVTVHDLELVRQELRGIIQFRKQDFPQTLEPRIIDVKEDESQVERRRHKVKFDKLADLDMVAYRNRVNKVLQAIIDQSQTLQKIKLGEPVSERDLEDLCSLVLTQEPGLDLHDLAEYFPQAGSLDRAIRSIIGMDAEAVHERFTAFVQAHPHLASHQIKFLDLLQNHIAKYGSIEIAQLYEPPFTALHIDGPDGLFDDPLVDELLDIIGSFSDRGAL